MMFGRGGSKQKAVTMIRYDTCYSDKEDFVGRWITVHQPYMASTVTSGSGVRPIYYSIQEVDELSSKLQTDPAETSDDGYMSVCDQPLTIEDLSSENDSCTRRSPIEDPQTFNISKRRNSKTEEWAQWRTEVNTHLADHILTRRVDSSVRTQSQQLGNISARSMIHITREAREKSVNTGDYIMYGVPRVTLLHGKKRTS